MKRTLALLVPAAALVAAAWFVAGRSGSSNERASRDTEAARRPTPIEAPETPDPPSARAIVGEDPPDPNRSPVAAATPRAPGSLRFGGRVTIDESRKFMGERGTPIPAAKVRLTLPESGEELAVATTDGDGGFSLQATLAPSRLPVLVRVAAEKAGHLSWTGSRWTVAVESLPHENTALDLVLGGSRDLAGRVVEALSETPIAGARVFQLTDEGTYAAGRQVHRHALVPLATSGADGNFRVPIPAGGAHVDLAVEADGHLPIVVRRVQATAPEATRVVRLARDDDFPRIEGRVVDGEDRPIAGATVSLSRHPGRGPEMRRPLVEATIAHRDFLEATESAPETTTDAEGRYRLRLFSPGTWPIAARSGPRLQEKYVDAFEVRVHECDFRLDGAVTLFVGEVRARSSGAPVANAQVVASASWVRWMGPNAFVTDAAGVFRCGPVPREPISFRVTAPGFAGGSHEIRPAATEQTTFTIELAEEGKARGRVVDGEGKAIPGASVTAFSPPAEVFSRARGDDDGYFEIGGLPVGRKVSLAVSATSQWSPTSREVEVTVERAGEILDLGTIALARR